MIFPIGDDQVKGGSYPYLSYLFIGINVLVFLFEITLSQADLNRFVMDYGAIPKEILGGEDYGTLVSSMFLHGGWMHLIGNMLFLWVFGDNIEAVIGNGKYFLFYMFGGFAASGAHIFFNAGDMIPSVGASGAISALLGAYLVMFPKSKIKIFVAYFFSSFKVTALYFLGFWIVQQLISGFISLGPDTAQTGGVAWWAHIGGFVFGVIVGFYFRQQYPVSLEESVA